MSTVLRLFVLIGILVGLIGAGVAMLVSGDAGAPPVASAAPLTSEVDEHIEDGWTVLDYAIAAGDAVVIRLSDDDLAACNFLVHTGPAQGSERLEPGVDTEWAIVPESDQDEAIASLADGCSEYWTRRD